MVYKTITQFSFKKLDTILNEERRYHEERIVQKLLVNFKEYVELPEACRMRGLNI